MRYHFLLLICVFFYSCKEEVNPKVNYAIYPNPFVDKVSVYASYNKSIEVSFLDDNDNEIQKLTRTGKGNLNEKFGFDGNTNKTIIAQIKIDGKLSVAKLYKVSK